MFHRSLFFLCFPSFIAECTDATRAAAPTQNRSRGRLSAALLLPLLVAACAEPASSSVSKEQHCPGGSTPVVDREWNPHGCNPAPGNVVTVGSDCSAFKSGALTADGAGRTYECR